ncbi:O-antigen translocase [Maritimibacter harenae]|nr:O-antigen translocase [Maritimibacter harenae]
MMVIGGAQAINILLSIIRMKVLALLLGPTGVGLLSIYNNLLSMASSAAGLGMGSSGVRQIASVKGEEQALSRVRRVLLAAHIVQGGLAMVAVWALREPLAKWLIGDPAYTTAVGLIGVAILLGLLGTAQTALLQGMRRIGDLGRITVFSALTATIVGLTAVGIWGENGLIWFVLIQPLATILVALRYTRRLPPPSSKRPRLAETWEIWKPMAKLGAAFMLGGLVTTATLLLVRRRITQELGLEAAGHFAAAWGITMTYVGFLLGAMGADYYPRLTEVIKDRPTAIRLMNDQAQLGLAIGGPVLLLLIGSAPWVITLLYSADFAPAVSLLQWQTVGNVFKLASWPLSFSVVAAARSKTFFFMELSFNTVFLTLTWWLLPVLGLMVTAIAFLAGYMVYFAAVNILAHTLQGFRWQGLSLALLLLHVSLATGLLLAAQTLPHIAAAVSMVLALGTGVFGLRVVLAKIGKEGRLPTQLYGLFDRIGWPIKAPV